MKIDTWILRLKILKFRNKNKGLVSLYFIKINQLNFLIQKDYLINKEELAQLYSATAHKVLRTTDTEFGKIFNSLNNPEDIVGMEKNKVLEFIK